MTCKQACPSQPSQRLTYVHRELPHPNFAYNAANDPSPWDPTQRRSSYSLEFVDDPSPSQLYVNEPTHSSSLPIPQTRTSKPRAKPPHYSFHDYTHPQLSPASQALGRGMSQTYSEDFGRSSLSSLPEALRPSNPIPSSSDPTEFGKPISTRQLDECSDSADIQAGVPLDFMEGLENAFSEECPSIQRSDLQGIVPRLPEHIDGDLLAFNSDDPFEGHFSVPSDSTASMPWSTYGNSFQRSNDRVMQSNRYEPEVAGSFPITQHHFPPRYSDPDTTRVRKSVTGSSSYKNNGFQPTRQATSNSQVPRKYLKPVAPINTTKLQKMRRRSTASSSKPDPSKLVAIDERMETSVALGQESPADETIGSQTIGSQPLQRTASGQSRQPKRTGRTGPLDATKRREIAEKRKSGNTCMQCRYRKITVGCMNACPTWF